MNDLLECVHAGVSASCADRFHDVPVDQRQRGFEPILDAATRRLSLPAAESRSVVLDSEHHSHLGDLLHPFRQPVRDRRHAAAGKTQSTRPAGLLHKKKNRGNELPRFRGFTACQPSVPRSFFA